MKISAVLMLLVSLVAVPAFAQSSSATLWITKQLNEESSGIDDDDPSLTAEIGSGDGYGASISGMFGRRLSGELSIFRISAPGEVRENGVGIAQLGDLEFTPITAMLRFHFRPEQRFDLYAGAGVAYVLIDDLDSDDVQASGLGPIGIDNETTAAFTVGATFDFSSRWGLAADVRYLPFEIAGRPAGETDSVTADVSPLLLSAGLRLRF